MLAMSSAQASPPSFPPGFFEQYTGNAPYGVAIAFIVIESLAVTLRFWARKIGKVAWGADDTLIIPGAILCLALCACSIGERLSGLCLPVYLSLRLLFFLSDPATTHQRLLICRR